MMRKQQIWNETKDYLFITIGLLLYTISFTVFLMPYQIVAGGVTGWGARVELVSTTPRASVSKTPILLSTWRCLSSR